MKEIKEEDYYQVCCDVINIIENDYNIEDKLEAYKFAISETKRLDEEIKKDLDIWLYPEDLQGIDLIINVFGEEGDYQVNSYDLPEDWRERVTRDKGRDGKPSIYDLMKESSK